MNFAQENNGSSRLTGFAVVVLVHVLIGWALASGLAKKAVDLVKGPIDVKVVEEQVKPPPPPEKVLPPPPDMKAPPPPFVPPPEVQVTAPAPAPTITTQSNTPPVSREVSATPPPQPAPTPAPKPAPAKGDVRGNCTKIGKFEQPSVQFNSEGLYKAAITVKAGRVVDVQWTKVRSVGDRKAERAILSSFQQTMMDTYECPGDHLLEQEFLVKPGD